MKPEQASILQITKLAFTISIVIIGLGIENGQESLLNEQQYNRVQR